MNMIRFGLAGVEIFFKLRAPTANLNEKRSSVSQLLGALVPNKIIGRHMLLCPQSLHLCQKCCNTVTQMSRSINVYSFFAVQCYASTAYAIIQCPFVCPSICLSHLWILSKRINISSNFFHYCVATSF